ncbi:hypothetical protein P2318_15355 [Myxococcaceae bacterium GXIMD 01537]
MTTSNAWGLVLCLAAGQALAQQATTGEAAAPAGPGDEPPGYCEYVRGVADANSALLFAPDVFVSGGVVNAGDATGGSPLGTPKPRLTVGVDYDFVGLYRGTAMRRKAQAECQRYRALSALQAAVQTGAAGIGAEPALVARAAVLEAALPQGEQLLASLREDVRDGRATVEELNALQLRLDGLRELASTTSRERAQLAGRPPLAAQPVSVLLRDLKAAEDAVEARAASLRSANAWQVRLRGGYDEVFGVDQEVPLSGTLTLSFNLGAMKQSEANARAREGRRLASEQEVEGIPRRVGQLLRELRVARETEQTRLREVTVLVTDLEGQLRGVEAMETRQVRRFRDYLLLELTRLRAEQAYLQAHVEGLDAFLGGEQP